MKSKRAEQVLDVASFTDEFDYRYVHFENACEAVDLAEQDAEEEVTRYRTELEESKKREELARKVIDDQRKEMEKLKARAVEAHRDCCMFRTRKEPLEPDDPFLCEANYHMQGELCDQDCGYMQIFIQKLNEQ